MTKLAHHPTDLTLAAYAAGTLETARRVVVAAHLELCPACRNEVARFERLAGAHLQSLPPAPMRAEAVEKALHKLDVMDAQTLSPRTSDEKLPEAVTEYDVGPWRWVGVGVQWRPVAVPVENDIRVFMLRAQPGTRLPHHKHAGIEWTCVLQGAYSHDLGRYGPGDFDEADESVEHKPVVEAGEPCICLVALQKNIELQSWLGRMIQPLIRL